MRLVFSECAPLTLYTCMKLQALRSAQRRNRYWNQRYGANGH